MAKFLFKVNPNGKKSQDGAVMLEMDPRDPASGTKVMGKRKDVCELRNNLIADLRQRELLGELLDASISLVDTESLQRSKKRNRWLAVLDFIMAGLDLGLALFFGLYLDRPLSIVFFALSGVLLVYGIKSYRDYRNLQDVLKEQAELEKQRDQFYQETEKIKIIKAATDKKLGF